MAMGERYRSDKKCREDKYRSRPHRSAGYLGQCNISKGIGNKSATLMQWLEQLPRGEPFNNMARADMHGSCQAGQPSENTIDIADEDSSDISSKICMDGHPEVHSCRKSKNRTPHEIVRKDGWLNLTRGKLQATVAQQDTRIKVDGLRSSITPIDLSTQKATRYRTTQSEDLMMVGAMF